MCDCGCGHETNEGNATLYALRERAARELRAEGYVVARDENGRVVVLALPTGDVVLV